MRQTSHVLYIAVDSFLPARGRVNRGFEEFQSALDHSGVPAVWLTSRSRLHLDEPRRKLGHAHPFIAEDGCGVYLPEDYFHLRPEATGRRSTKPLTMRLGRFTCIPVAEPLPAAAEALEALSAERGVPMVTLRSLSPRELAQNTGLPQREAELARQRDFDELFFFAGASDRQVQQFLAEGGKRKLAFRPHGVLWSAAVGASVPQCVREATKLYDRAFHRHVPSVGLAAEESAPELFPFCDRAILLVHRTEEETAKHAAKQPRAERMIVDSPDDWEQILQLVAP